MYKPFTTNPSAKSGLCPRCGRLLKSLDQQEIMVCECYRYCPLDHGNGIYGTLMVPYMPEKQQPLASNDRKNRGDGVGQQTYGPIRPFKSDQWGDLDHPNKIIMHCPLCNHYSEQLPIEVVLS
jgi:hypothetical protein